MNDEYSQLEALLQIKLSMIEFDLTKSSKNFSREDLAFMSGIQFALTSIKELRNINLRQKDETKNNI